MKDKVVVSWSGGKDSMFALDHILQEGKYEVESLLTTITSGYGRISMHGVREKLLEQQASALGFPIRKMYIPQHCTHSIYQQLMVKELQKIKQNGIDTVVFGDIFLEDVRAYREKLAQESNIECIYPLWQVSTETLITAFMERGFKTITSCIDTEKLPPSFLGTVIDSHFVAELPDKVDPCGEHGEFHTFVYDGPVFKHAIRFSVGETVERGQFHFCELIPDH